MRTVQQWFLTFPQSPKSPEDLLEAYESLLQDYAIVQEKHKDDGLHLHAYFKLKQGIELKKANDIFRQFADGNWQPCRSVKAVLKYISKENPPLSNFDINNYVAKRGKVNIETLKTKSVAQALEAGDISFMQCRPYVFAQGCVLEPYTHDTVRGEWVYGPSGSGKTTYARSQGDDVFIKSQNKWWDGYNGQEVVVLDDLDTDCLNHYLKIWGDKWACSGEVKGGTVQLRHKKIIVTSNYPIKHFTKDDHDLWVAIARRFPEKFMT